MAIQKASGTRQRTALGKGPQWKAGPEGGGVVVPLVLSRLVLASVRRSVLGLVLALVEVLVLALVLALFGMCSP